MYRIKEAFIIFWAVLTHKNYFFASVKSVEVDHKALCFISAASEQSPIFLDTVSQYAYILKNKIKK